MLNTEQELNYREFIMRENESFHASYSPEFDFYVAVKNGDIKKVSTLCENNFSEKKGFGKLSESPLQSLKYHFVITAALIARYCIEGGMAHEQAYSLSDVYIQRADKCISIEQVSMLHDAMSLDYTKRMKILQKGQVFSVQIVRSIDYIYNHLHQRIKIQDLATYTGLHPSYLSKLFKKETGLTVTDYIQKRKVETAKNMLKYSDYLPSQIASFLAYHNQSYFIEIFKKEVGMTPKKYRDQAFRETGIQ